MLPALLLSLFGYYLFYHCVVRKSPAFFPISFISFVSVFVYLAGLLGHIDLGTRAVTGLGFFLYVPAFFSCFRKAGRGNSAAAGPDVKISKAGPFFKQIFFNETVLFMSLSCIWIYFLLKGALPSHCDDFTHWYRVCKIMHADHALPSSPDLRFQYYTPGTAVWIYYVTSYLPYSVSNCFRAQSVLNASCVAALLSVIPKKANLKTRALTFLYVCLAGVVLCAMDVTTFSLLVDGTLALVPLAALVMILIDQERNLWQFILLLLISVLTALIKNSGLLFSAFIAAAWLIWRNENLVKEEAVKKKASSRRIADAVRAIALVLVPYVLFKLYQIRAARIFGNSGEGRHEVSLERYRETFTSHGLSSNLSVIKNMFYHVFLVQKGNPQIRMLWLTLLLAAGVFLVKRYRRREQSAEKKLILYCVCCSVIYLLGLMMTYLFSMDKTEIGGTGLASFARYSGTITIFVSGLVFLYFARLAMEAKERAQDLALFAAFSFLLLAGTSLFDTGYIWGFDYYSPIEPYSMQAWEYCEKYITENWEYSPEEYTVVWNPDDYTNDLTEVKISFLIMTYMRSDDVHRISLYKFRDHSLSERDLADLEKSDYLILLGDFADSYDEIREYVTCGELAPGLNKLK